MKIRIYYSMLRLTLMITFILFLNSLRAQNLNKLDSVITKGIAEYSFPGGAIIIADRSEIIYSKNFGVSSVELQVPVSDSTVFHLASATKIFTCTLAMLLAEQGYFNLSDSIGKYLDWIPESWKDIRISHLLNHTSGIPNHFRTEEWKKTPESEFENIDVKETIQYSIRAGLQFTPGERFSYNITSYILFAEIVKVATGKTIPDLMRSQIFSPLNLSSCVFGDYNQIVPNRNSNVYKNAEGRLVNSIFEYGLAGTTAAGLNGKANDIYKFLKCLMKDGIISEKGRSEMMSPTILNDGKILEYGLGWSINSIENIKYIGHEGGGCIWLYYLPDTSHYIIFLTNLTGARADKLIEEIVVTLSLL